MKNRNALTVGLMITSIVLLILLEGLWLYRSYEKEWFDLRRDAGIHLRSAVSELRDSVLFQNVEPVSGDTALFVTRDRAIDTLVHHSITRVESTIHSTGDDESTHSNVRLFITTPSDSLRPDIVKPLLERLAQTKGEPGRDKTFVIRLTQDTVPRTLLARRYRESLARQDIVLSVVINAMQAPDERHLGTIRKGRMNLLVRSRTPNVKDILADTLTTDAAFYNPVRQYSASLVGTRSFLFREIAPEILFVLLLTALTGSAFILVYRNLRSQQRLVQAKNDFISNITHELKTPVATVSVALEALQNFNAMDKRELAAEYLEIALKELGRLSIITDNILQISVLENNPVAIPKRKLDLKVVADEVVTRLKVHAESKNGVISLISEGDDFTLTGSEEYITNAITNLVDNAIKYSPGSPLIGIKIISTPETLTISVADNGIGIDAEFHEKIFEKFFRVSQGDVHTVKGHGLGLNYVKSVATLHRGTVSLQSEPGKGSEFTITFSRSSV